MQTYDDAVVLTLIPDLPAGVVGVQAQGEVTARDYEEVLVPAVSAAQEVSAEGRVRILYVLDSDFPDYTAGAAWEDAKLGLGRIRSWERIAIVSDAEWLQRAVRGLGWMMPGEVRVFGLDHASEARAWIAS